MIDLQILRVLAVLLLGAVGYYFRPFQLDPVISAGLGVVCGLIILVIEWRLRHATAKQLIGAACGALIGVAIALLASMIIGSAARPGSEIAPFVQISLLILGGFLGLTLGGARGELLSFSVGASPVVVTDLPSSKFHILDTSVIIDGRIADIAETGFIDGGLAIPQFVLARTPAGSRFSGLVEAQSRPPRPRCSAAASKNAADFRGNSRRRFRSHSRCRHEACRTRQASQMQSHDERLQPEQSCAATRRDGLEYQRTRECA